MAVSMQNDTEQWLAVIRDRLSKRLITQTELESETRIDQSQISRILSGRYSRTSKNVLKLCKYAKNRFPDAVTSKVTETPHPVLLEAIQTTWDGSEAHAQALAKIIRSLAVLTPLRKTEH